MSSSYQDILNDKTIEKLVKYQNPEIGVSERDVQLLAVQATMCLAMGIQELNKKFDKFLAAYREVEK